MTKQDAGTYYKSSPDGKTSARWPRAAYDCLVRNIISRVLLRSSPVVWDWVKQTMETLVPASVFGGMVALRGLRTRTVLLRFAQYVCAVAVVFPNLQPLFAQSYPTKPIHILTSNPGGALDFAARLLVPPLTSSLGQAVIIENRGAAGGAIAADTVAKASPDGYTLIFYGPPLWLLPFMRSNLTYDPVKDFSPITLVARSPNLIVVHQSLPVKSLAPLIPFS